MAWDYEAGMRQLQESITVLTRMESRHDARLQDHHEWFETLQMAHELERQRLAKWQEAQEQEMALHKQRMARMDEILLEVGEKLDALMHIVDGSIGGKQK
jgi:hypothetical protein